MLKKNRKVLMTKEQLHRQLKFIHKDLTKAQTRMQKLAKKLGFTERQEYVDNSIKEVEELIKMFDSACPECGLIDQHKMSCDTQYKDKQ